MFKLNGTQIKTPSSYKVVPIEIATTNETISGVTKKQIRRKKNAHILTYDFISRSDMSTINDIYGLNTDVSFQVDETNKSVGPLQVHVQFNGARQYIKGSSFNEVVELILLEV